MKDTICTSRAPEVEQKFQEFLRDFNGRPLREEFEKDVLSETQVDNLRIIDGFQIEYLTDALQIPHFVMHHPFPYDGWAEHFVFYAGKSDLHQMGVNLIHSDPSSPRFPSFVAKVKAVLATCAAAYAMRTAQENYVILSREGSEFSYEDETRGIRSYTPYIQLLFPTKNAPKIREEVKGGSKKKVSE